MDVWSPTTPSVCPPGVGGQCVDAGHVRVRLCNIRRQGLLANMAGLGSHFPGRYRPVFEHILAGAHARGTGQLRSVSQRFDRTTVPVRDLAFYERSSQLSDSRTMSAVGVPLFYSVSVLDGGRTVGGRHRSNGKDRLTHLGRAYRDPDAHVLLDDELIAGSQAEGRVRGASCASPGYGCRLCRDAE